MNSESEGPRINTRLWVRTASVHTQASRQAGYVSEWQAVISSSDHDELVRAVDALVLMPVAGVGAGQAA